jgi:hypothetical protein
VQHALSLLNKWAQGQACSRVAAMGMLGQGAQGPDYMAAHLETALFTRSRFSHPDASPLAAASLISTSPLVRLCCSCSALLWRGPGAGG